MQVQMLVQITSDLCFIYLRNVGALKWLYLSQFVTFEYCDIFYDFFRIDLIWLQNKIFFVICHTFVTMPRPLLW